jgi:hypothetical protein
MDDTIIDSWMKHLLDFSKRNRLIRCRIGRRNTLELHHTKIENIFQRLIVEEKNRTFSWKNDLLDKYFRKQAVAEKSEEEIEKKIPVEQWTAYLTDKQVITPLSDKEDLKIVSIARYRQFLITLKNGIEKRLTFLTRVFTKIGYNLLIRKIIFWDNSI